MRSPVVEPIDGGRVRVHVDAQMDLEHLDALIQQLGAARATIAHDPTNPKGLNVQVAADPAFWVEVSPATDWKSTVLFRHPSLGWTGFSLGLVETTRLAKLLEDNLLVMIERESAGSAAAGGGGHRP